MSSAIKGQALAEACLWLLLCVVFYAAASWLFQQATKAQQLQSQVGQEAFLMAHFQAYSLPQSTNVTRLPEQQGDLSAPWQASYQDLRLSKEMVGVQGLVRAPLPAAQGELLIQRHSVWMQGSGHANSPHEVSQRLENSASLWAELATPSMALLRQLRTAFKANQAYWNKEAPGTDWIRPWQNQVPVFSGQP